MTSLRLQTNYIDMRPQLVKWGGLFVSICGLVFFLISAKPDIDRSVINLMDIYKRSVGVDDIDLMVFWVECMKDIGCREAVIMAWSAPLILKCFVVTCILFGVICFIFGLWWRPEISNMRDLRLNAQKIEKTKMESPVAPKGVV